MKHAIVAAEDNTFYTNSGVDLKGVIRAAWNNLTGGAQQGGSTITQQYARNVLNLEGATYARKIREAILAMKLSQRYKKDQILNFYLNIVYFGRGAYGVEAAAQAYFKKDASALTKAECMALAELVKDPAGSDGYDPAINLPSAQSRFGYVNDQMLKLNFETQADHDGAKYPTNWIKPNPGQENGQFGLDTATGFIVHHVMDELSHLTKADGTQEFPDLQNGGYKIITTIDKNLEQDAINAASPVVKGSVLDGQPKNLISALVAVQPGTGRVLAYYGGDNGAGLDRAGIYNDPVLAPATDGSDGWTGENHQAGSTFKVVTMAAALKAHYSIDSYWYGPAARYFPDQARCPTPLTPAAKAAGCTQPGVGAVTTGSDKCPDNSLPIPNVCPMWEGLVRSTNTMYFAIDDAIGTPNVIDMAKALGVHWMWDNDHKRIDLTATTGAKLEGRITAEVSYGQFGVTVIDQADVAATVASRGVQAQTHFVSKVLKGSQTVLQERIRQNNLNSFGLTPEMLDDETWAMGQVNHGAIHGAKNQLAGLWADDGAGMTGTWELCATCSNSSYNGNAWYTGFTPTLAATVWLGADPSVKVPGIPDGAIMYKAPGVSKLQNVNGFDIPGSIWKRFMDAALKGAKPVAFHSRKDVGDPSRGDPTLGPNYSPVPSLSPSPTDTGQPTGGPGGGSCGPLPIFCPPPSSSGGGHGGTGGGPSPRRSH
jgi:membrane peptidoglycan carboxypeptidase